MPDQEHDFFPLTHAGRHAPAGLGRLHQKTWVRWAMKGVGTPRVRLATWKLGGRRYTTRRAIEQFLEALNPRTTPTTAHPLHRHEQADHELEAEGF